MQIQLNGVITKDEGMVVADVTEIGQCTWGYSLDQVMEDLPRLIIAHFAALRLIGQYDATLARLGVIDDGQALHVNLHVSIGVDALPQPTGASMSIDSQVVVPQPEAA